MADALKLSQLSTILAQQGLQGTAYNPGMQAYMQSLVGSGQSATQAEAQKKAEKDAKKKNGGASTLLGAAGTVGGAMIGGPAGAAIGGSLGSAAGQAVSGGSVDPAAIAQAGVSGYAGQMAPDIGTLFKTAQANAGPTSPIAPKGGMPMETKMNPGPTSPMAPSGGSSNMAGNAGSAGMSGAPAPTPGGGAGNALLSAAPLIGAGLGAMAGGKSAYTSPVSAPKNMQRVADGGGTGAGTARYGGGNVEGMSPQELREFMKNDPNANEAMMNYLQGGGSLTNQQASMIPRNMQKVYRSAGMVGMPTSGAVAKERVKKALMGLAVGYGVSGGMGGGGGAVPSGTYDYQ
jgi:hypothetical protein